MLVPELVTTRKFSTQVLTPEQHEAAERNEYNFDHIDAFDFELCCDSLKKLKQGKKVDIPIYDFTAHSRKRSTVSQTSVTVSSPFHPHTLHVKNIRIPLKISMLHVKHRNQATIS